MANRNFLDEFQLSMDKLNESRRKIQEGVNLNNQFTNILRDKLAEINSRLRDYAGQIQQLKETADNLKDQVDANTASIGDREKQMQELNQRVAQSQQDRDTAVANAEREKTELQNKIAEKQAEIDKDEQKLLDLTEQLRQANENLQIMTNQKDALDNELRGKGDLAQQHADEINRLTQEAQAVAQQREEQFKDVEDLYIQRIDSCEKKIQESEQKIADKDAEIGRVTQEHDTTKGNATNQANTLQAEIDRLNDQNANLTQRIIKATEAISEAADQLIEFSKNITNAQTESELNAMLTDIEKSLGLIGRAIQGQRAAAAPQRVNPTQSKLPDNIPIIVDDATSGQQVQMPLNAIKAQLLAKAQQQRRTNPNVDNKYQTAFDEINQATTPTEVTNFLRGITIKNTQRGLEVSGGSKTKKNRKQKGGFTYKSSSTRRSISPTSKSSKRSSRRSSR